MKKLILSFGIVLFFGACATHTHVIGDGPSTGLSETKRQYYALYGLVPLNKVDTNAMVGDATGYRLETGAEAVDIIIGAVGGSLSITSRTVTVTK
tara:strand:- start:842 stop:1126 length:285 start_codon:yes stop_codon:yes gene_type:complete